MGLLMLRELLRQGVEVDLYTPRYSFDGPALKPTPGLRIIERRSGWRWGRWYSRTKVGAFFSGTASRTVSHLILNVRLLIEHRRNPYDAVYQLSTTELFLLGYLKRFAPPIVVHPCTHAAGELRWHRAEQEYALQVERRSIHKVVRGWLTMRSRLQPKPLAQADLVLGLSERFNELLQQDYGVPRDKLDVVRTAVDLRRFTPEGPTEPADKQTLLFISRISTRKGVEDVIELSHRLDDLAGSVRLLVVGGPTQWSDYTGHLRRLNPRVAEYVGHLPIDQLPALMRSGAVLVVPSRYEPGSIATAEALACGVPVVLSTEVGNAEMVEGPHVALHQPGDTDGLELAVRTMLARLDGDAAAVRGGARANAEAVFSPEVVVGELVRLLAAVASPSAEQSAELERSERSAVLPDAVPYAGVSAGQG
jgi:glycosyltransferase involved in cell wall biosynthesis